MLDVAAINSCLARACIVALNLINVLLYNLVSDLIDWNIEGMDFTTDQRVTFLSISFVYIIVIIEFIETIMFNRLKWSFPMYLCQILYGLDRRFWGIES